MSDGSAAMTFAVFCFLLLQQTWVVDDNGGPGVNFTDLPPAVAAAADGDILVVLPGVYSHFTISGKNLRVFGSGAATTGVSIPAPLAQTTLVNLPVASATHLEGLRFDGTGAPFAWSPRVIVSGATTRATFVDVSVVGPSTDGSGSIPALLILGAEVTVARSTLQGGAGGNASWSGGGTPGGTGLMAQNGALVHVSSSSVSGGSGGGGCMAGTGGAGGIGVAAVTASQVWIADSTVTGGGAGCCIPSAALCPCDVGGPGIQAIGSFVRISGDSTSEVRGGAAAAYITGPAPCSNGGPGIFALGSVVDAHSVPVVGGCTTIFTCNPVPPTNGGGTVTLNLAPLPVLEASGTLTTSGTATIALANGPPAAVFAIAFAGASAHLSAGPLFLGEILIDPTEWFPLAVGALSATGDFSMTVPLTGIAPTFLYLPVHLQAIVLDPGGTYWRVSNSTVVAIRP